MPIVPRPRPNAGPPATPLAPSKPVAPGPANDDGNGILGSWENGVFKFASPQARETWQGSSYLQGVNADTWALGKEIDPQTAGLAQAGLAGAAMPGLYKGPDGKYRQMNQKTIESQDARDHRNRFLTGKSMDQIAAAGTMPGANEWVAKWKAVQAAANDNAADVKPAPQMVPVTQPSPAVPAKSNLQADAGAGRTMGGRFAAMQEAQKNADTQTEDDLARIAVNSILGNYGDEARAGFSAAGAYLDGKSFGDAYDSNLLKERYESTAAQERQGLTGTGVELLTSFIPIVGDLSGALADFKDWKEHGDQWGWEDYGLVALGVAPGMLNHRLVKKGEKVLGDLLDDGKIARSEGALDLQKSPLTRGNSLDQYLPSNEIIALTQLQAEALTGRNRGLFYMTESFTGKEPAKIFHDGTVGAFSSIEHKKRVVPALRYDNPDGKNFIRFDGIEIAKDGSHILLIDAKRSLPLWKPSAMNDLKDTLERIKKAVHQNNTDGVDGAQYKIVYEFQTRYAAKVAAMFLASSGYGDLISVRVRQ